MSASELTRQRRLTYVTLLASQLLLPLLLCAGFGRPAWAQEDHEYPPSGRVAGPLWLAEWARPQNETTKISQKLDELLRRTGPNMRASADYRDHLDLGLGESLEAWRLLREETRWLAEQQVRLYKPRLARLLGDAQVGGSCSQATVKMMDAMERLDSWAVQMYSYSGSFPPGGLLDGQFTDLGHYRGCVDLQLTPRPSSIASRHPASYCVLGFRPIVPTRKRFHLIFEEESRELLSLFNATDVFATLAHRAQYFHYVYMKTGLCVPSECSALEIQQIAALIGRRLTLEPAPVKCFTRARNFNTSDSRQQLGDELDGLENSKPVFVDLNGEMNAKQVAAVVLIASFFSVVLVASLWHGLEIVWQTVSAKSGRSDDEFGASDDEFDGHDANNNRPFPGANIRAIGRAQGSQLRFESNTLRSLAFNYFSVITNGREFLDTSMRASEIRCLHGLRVFSMVWIICVHTLQYNEWSGFTRIFENEPSFQNPFVHPLINANYVVDNFFLMSGLLAAYTAWHSTKGAPSNFNVLKSLLGRYLRLTPQVLLISLMYIALPLVGQNGPFWYDMTHYSAKYCEKNWWVNLLHVQAFYRKDEMCNLVGWWISVDMFYYVLGLALLWMTLNKHTKLAFSLTGLYVTYCTVVTAWRHYTGGFSPNNLGLIPQVQEVWRDFVVDFYWSPGPHAFVFFLGFWLGYALANKLGVRRVRRWSRLGWLLSLATFLGINLSSRLWTTGALELKPENQYISTSYNIACVVGWACSFGWMIVACHYGCAPGLNRLLSTNISVMLSKASFIIYLSHMLILRTFFGSQYNLLEVSIGTISLMMMGLIVWSIFFGVFLCVAFEGPCLKFQRLVLRTMKGNHTRAAACPSHHVEHNGSSIANEDKVTLRMSPASTTLLK